ncbi:hypothetical protein [Microbispora sp. NBC_01389]|uniref:hypothetical protein n=1 Tax=Microbispora sp. NBC_01389 TaxID=2903584 RepID=UPI00324B99AC
MIVFITVALVMLLSCTVVPVCGSIWFATRAARSGRRRGLHVLRGLVVAAGGVVVLALVAWNTRIDEHYDDFGSLMTTLAGIAGGALLVVGIGPCTPWLLGVLGRRAVRLPPVFRTAARRMAGRPAAVAATVAATALAATVMIIQSAVDAQGRATYEPEARMGTPVERGYESGTGWRVVIAAAVLVAFACALAMIRTVRPARVLDRVSGGLRMLLTCRAAFGAACGTVIGTAVGCVIGLLLAWPMTAPIDWEPPPRAPFETPWALLAALAFGLPVLAAAVTVLAPLVLRVAGRDRGR